MKKITEYLQDAYDKAGSQAKLAGILHISQGYMNRILAGEWVPQSHTCVYLADYIDQDCIHVMIAAEIARAKTTIVRRKWETLRDEILKRKGK